MDEEKKEAGRKIQLALVKCIGLSDADTAWLSEYEEPGTIENIRIAIQDGMTIETAKETFSGVTDPDRAKQLRMRFYREQDAVAEVNELMLAITNRIDVLQENIEKQISNISTDKEIIRLGEKMERWMEDQKKEQFVSPLQKQEKENKKGQGLFKKKDKEDSIMQLVQKGKFTPEQLAEVTESINAGLPEELLSEIAKPSLTPAAMKQLRLFYLARQEVKQTKLEQQSQEKLQEPPSYLGEDPGYEYEDEDESEDYG